jgi:hypothetical protein
VRYDPVQGFIAQGVPPDPVGTLDELKAHNLPTKAFSSCSAPSNDGTSRGCRLWHECSMSYKGLPVAEGGGPRAHGWELIKGLGQGGGIVRTAAPCYWGVGRQDEVYQNEGVLRVIADEGEEIEVLTMMPDKEGTRDNLGWHKWDEKLVKNVVRPFPRLGEEKKLAQHELRASIMQREQERLKNERAAKTLGVEGSGEALDKRGRRSKPGAAKEGSGDA